MPRISDSSDVSRRSGSQGPSGWVVYGAHNASLVGSDRWVDAGDLVAHVGDSGDARGGQPHLHLGLRRGNGSFINPYPSLSAAC